MAPALFKASQPRHEESSLSPMSSRRINLREQHDVAVIKQHGGFLYYAIRMVRKLGFLSVIL